MTQLEVADEKTRKSLESKLSLDGSQRLKYFFWYFYLNRSILYIFVASGVCQIVTEQVLARSFFYNTKCHNKSTTENPFNA